jgi:putative DNA primase/helicase
MERWRATDNGLESVAMQHNDTLLILDELAQIDPKVAGETAYMLGNGCGKIRANKSGNAKGKAVWRALFLSAGEISLTEHMASAGKVAKAGQEIRLIDVPADAGVGLGLFENLHGHLSGADFSDALKLSSSRYYGTPLIAFLERLTGEDYYVIKSELEKFQKQFLGLIDLNKAGGQAQRVAARFAIIAAAGELASSFSITGWEAGEAIKAVKTCFDAWADNREGTGQMEHHKMVDQLQHFLENHGESRFSLFDDSVTISRTINRVGFRKLDKITGAYTYYILPEAWSKEICAGFNTRDMTAYLLANGYLERGTDNKGTHPVRLPGMGLKRCYRVGSSAFTADEVTVAPQESGNTGNEGNIPFDDADIPF